MKSWKLVRLPKRIYQEFKDGYDTRLNVVEPMSQVVVNVFIARALLMNPKILILDDSTSAVDTKTDSLIRQRFGIKS